MTLSRPAQNAWIDYVGVGLLAALVFTVAHWHGLTNPSMANDDIRQQIFWMQKWIDPALYPDDPLSRYAELYVPPGVKALYRAAALCFDPVFFSKLLTGLAFVLLSVCLYGVGRSLADPDAATLPSAPDRPGPSARFLGLAVVLVSWLMPFYLYNMSGGISRSFASPLLALFLWQWLRKSSPGLGLALLLQALFIPYIFILCLGACLISVALARLRPSLIAPYPARWPHLLVLLLGAGLVLHMQSVFDAAGYGPLVTAAEMAGRPEFTAQGRLELYPQPGLFMDAIYYPWERIGLFLEFGLAAGILSLTVIIPLTVYCGTKVPWRGYAAKAGPILCLALASITLYTAARVLLFKLFVPDRYLSYFLNMLYGLVLALCLAHGARRFLHTRTRVIVLILVLTCLGAVRLRDQGLFDYSANAPLYETLSAMPKDALYAGHPKLMDDVLTFGRRKAFVTYKLAHVWSKGWWRWYEPRLSDFFKAYYAGDAKSVLDFCKARSVDYLLVDEDHFTSQFLNGRPFFAPFDASIKSLAGKTARFALLDADAFPFTRAGTKLRVIDVRNALALAEKKAKIPAAQP